MTELLSYECLQIIWFLLWGLLWAIYFMLDGFDLGMGMLLPFIAKNEHEKRVIYNAAGPFWDGNEVWLITAGGVTFAAFPLAYATMFSALYAPLLILLFALIFRAVSFEYRNKIDNPGWRTIADVCQSLGSFLPALLLGVAFANLFSGLPIDYEGIYYGNTLKLLSVYGLLGGVLFVLMFCLHGALFLGLRSVGEIHQRALDVAKNIWIVLLAVAVAFLLATKAYTSLYDNYFATPALWLIPIVAVASLVLMRAFISADKLGFSFILSCLFIVSVTFFGVIGMFPSLIPAIDPGASVTLERAASSHYTLGIMFIVAGIFVPIVIFYQAWVYKIFSYKLTPEELESKHTY